MEGQFLLLVLTVSLCEWQVLALPPHEQCRTNHRYVADHNYPDNWHLLMDNYDYENLISGTGPVWKRSDKDGDGKQWTHGIGGTCQRSIAALDTYESPNQNNWVFTHYIDYDEAVEVIVNVTFRFSSCTPNPRCVNDFVTLYRYDTNTPNENQQIEVRNYQPLLGSEEESRLQQTSSRGDVRIILTYSRPTNFNGFYLALRDTGTDGFVRRVYVYYKIAPSYTDGLIVCPEIPLRSSGTSTEECTCADNAMGTSLTRLCSPDGTCQGSPVCSCLPGYQTMESNCEGCPAGMYRSTSDQTCLQCPANTVTDKVAAPQCNCLDGYFRANGERPGDDCIAPPSLVRDLQVSSTTNTSVTLRWGRPTSDRSDVYYTIYSSVNGDPPELVANITNPSLNVLYTVSQLMPGTRYTFSVIAHNGVSDLDRGNECTRTAQIQATTRDGFPSRPENVRSLCAVVVWAPPAEPNGVIVGYDINFYVPGRSSLSRVVHKDATATFHIVEENDIPSMSGTFVQVRAHTNVQKGGGAGAWSFGQRLGCDMDGNIPTPCPFPQVVVELKGKTYLNNTVVIIDDIGEGPDALMCTTTYEDCCDLYPNRRGEWFYPNGMVLQVHHSGDNLYRNRGVQSVRLNRRNVARGPLGTYRCDIPDESGRDRSIFINVVTRNPMEMPTESTPCPDCVCNTKPPASCPDPTPTPHTQCDCNSSASCDPNDLHSPNHGAVSVLNNVASYSCDDPYLLQGGCTRICSNGVWTGVAPTCVLPECRLELNSKVYANNSVIRASDIGEGSEALHCVTGHIECCSKRQHPNRVGEFYYPDGGKVRVSAAGNTLYRTRGNQRIFLNRRGGGQVPSGLYCCEIPASDSEIKRLCVTINN